MLLVSASLGTQARASEAVTHWALPPAALTGLERPHQPAVFGTMPLPVRVRPTSTRWSRIMNASLDQPALARLASVASAMPTYDQLAFVQSAISDAVRIDASDNNCADDGYWAPASETLARGHGDCIDIAIAKMEALRFLGISATDMYLTTGYVRTGSEAEKGRESAALLVRIGESFWLLPERTGQIIEANGTAQVDPANHPVFTPVVTYGVGSTWIHGRIVRTAALGN